VHYFDASLVEQSIPTACRAITHPKEGGEPRFVVDLSIYPVDKY
jgi:hypothetical protein